MTPRPSRSTRTDTRVPYTTLFRSLSTLQQARVVYVMTHDSIGLGEDGPTHQPIEHVMSLRMIPNLDVYRPADAVETAECWQLALKKQDGPGLLALTPQNLPQLRLEKGENLCARGAYRLRAATRSAGPTAEHQ